MLQAKKRYLLPSPTCPAQPHCTHLTQVQGKPGELGLEGMLKRHCVCYPVICPAFTLRGQVGSSCPVHWGRICWQADKESTFLTLRRQRVWLCKGGWSGSPSQACTSVLTKLPSPHFPSPFLCSPLMLLWLKVFVRAEHLCASVSPLVKRQLTDPPASLGGLRNWKMTDIWEMLWGRVSA